MDCLGDASPATRLPDPTQPDIARPCRYGQVILAGSRTGGKFINKSFI
jgi:hypothetical protein